MKKICSAVVLAAFALTVSAQSASDTNQSYSGTNSPYSQYGLGELADQSSGFNRGLNGPKVTYFLFFEKSVFRFV
jgi:hypothetical protein